MAKPQGSQNSKPTAEEEPEGAPEGESGDDDGPPPGYGFVTPQQGRQNWWVLKPGAVIWGRLLGVFERRGGNEGQFLQIRVAKPTKAVIKGGEEVTVAVNGTVNVDVKAGLKDVAKLAKDGGVYDVWIKAVEKEDIRGGKTFWRYDVRNKMIKPPMVRTEEKSTTDDADIPF